MSKVALITGITGQDGSYLSEFLTQKGYTVHGIRRRSSSFNTQRIEPLLRNGTLKVENLHYGDLTDFSSCMNVVTKVQPDEIYHLAAQSHVGVSFENPEYTGNVDALGTLRILEAARIVNGEGIRLYQASTSELYGRNVETPQNELTEFMPCSPYAISKMYSFSMAKLYREAYGIFVSNGILFNHESPRRGETFVTRKITRHVARHVKGSKEILLLGNLNAIRDWGHARDYVEGMQLILNHETPDDFVLATGVGRTVREFVDSAYAYIGTEVVWDSSDSFQVGRDRKSGTLLVQSDASYLRPLEVPILIGDASKAQKELGWTPRTSFEQIVSEMMENDLAQSNFI
jgi:GDPmannose 4,6-dehydratase